MEVLLIGVVLGGACLLPSCTMVLGVGVGLRCVSALSCRTVYIGFVFVVVCFVGR